MTHTLLTVSLSVRPSVRQSVGQSVCAFPLTVCQVNENEWMKYLYTECRWLFLSLSCASALLHLYVCGFVYLNVFKRPTIWKAYHSGALSVAATQVAVACTFIVFLSTGNHGAPACPMSMPQHSRRPLPLPLPLPFLLSHFLWQGPTDKPICLCVFGFGCLRWDKSKYVALVWLKLLLLLLLVLIFSENSPGFRSTFG